jgi:hypothetical protein
VADGHTTVRAGVPPGGAALTLDSHLASYVFRAGHRLRLAIENLVWHRPPTGLTDHIRMLPVFTDFQVQVRREAARPSWIDVPVSPLDDPSLVASAVELRDGNPADVRYALQADTAEAGRLYFVALGVSGTSPGFGFGGTTIPLNPDWLTSIVLTGPSAFPFSGFSGLLDANGRAEPVLQLSALPSLGLAGLKLAATGLVLDSMSGGLRASPAIEIPIVP